MKRIAYIFTTTLALLLFFGFSMSTSDLIAQRSSYPSPSGSYYGGKGQHYASSHGHAPRHRQVVRKLHPHARAHRMGRTVVYSHRGTFYRKGRHGFRVIPAPVGLRVHRLPRHARQISNGHRRIFVSQGTFYQYRPRVNAYEVVPPPAPRYRSPYGSGPSRGQSGSHYEDRYRDRSNDRYDDWDDDRYDKRYGDSDDDYDYEDDRDRSPRRSRNHGR